MVCSLARPNSSSVFLGVSGRCPLGAAQNRPASGEKTECVLSLSGSGFDNSLVFPFLHVLPILRIAHKPTMARPFAASTVESSATRKLLR